MMPTFRKAMLVPALTALVLSAGPAMLGSSALAAGAAAQTERKAEEKPVATKMRKAEKASAVTGKTTARQAARKAVEKKVKAEGAAKADVQRQKIFQDAVAALRETQNAIVALRKKDKDKALAALEKALGKLDLVLARDPKLALAPVDVTTRTLDLYADVKSVRKAVKQAIDLLEKGRVQDARALVSGLASEIVIEVANIPLATYPDAIRAVVPLIEAGEYEEAREALIAALNTLVITRHIIPLPIVRAEQMIERAEALAEKAKRSEAEEKELAGLLEAVRAELEFAEALGYGRKEDFKAFRAELDKIAKKTRHGGHGKGFFDVLKKALADFRAKLF